MKRSAGILPFRRERALDVLIAHPGGPYFAGRDFGSWSIVKGQIEHGEDPWETARREFREETGWEVPDIDPIDLGHITQKSGKRVDAFAVASDFDVETFEPGMFEMVWRGRLRTFPEVDRVRWVSVADAAKRLNQAQVPLLTRLETVVAGDR